MKSYAGCGCCWLYLLRVVRVKPGEEKDGKDSNRQCRRRSMSMRVDSHPCRRSDDEKHLSCFRFPSKSEIRIMTEVVKHLIGSLNLYESRDRIHHQKLDPLQSSVSNSSFKQRKQKTEAWKGNTDLWYTWRHILRVRRVQLDNAYTPVTDAKILEINYRSYNSTKHFKM